ncbi:MAG: hypothetical protein ACJAXE_002835 [Neolewinella sp.]|jgi:hypothetical protein
MSHNEDELGTGEFASKFHASQNIFADKITCNTGDKNIADALVEDVFNGYSAVYARQSDGFRELGVGTLTCSEWSLAVRSFLWKRALPSLKDWMTMSGVSASCSSWSAHPPQCLSWL